MKIVVLMNSVPFPVRKNGVSIRYFPLIRELAKLGHQINLFILPRRCDSVNNEYIKEIQDLGVNVSVCTKPNEAKSDVLSTAVRVFKFFQQYPTPTNEAANGLESKSGVLEGFLTHKFDLGIAVGSDNFKIMNDLPTKTRPNRIVLDFIDSPALHYSRSNLPKKSNLKNRIIYEINNRLYPKWERNIGKQAYKVAYISTTDAEYCDMYKSSNNSIVINGLTR
jgi:hypothetical protein